MQSVQKPVWDWESHQCLHLLVAAMREETFWSKVCKRLDEKFLPANGNPDGITRNVMIGAFRRGSAQKRLMALGYDAQEITLLTNKFGDMTKMQRRRILLTANPCFRRKMHNLPPRKPKKREDTKSPVPRAILPDIEPLRLPDGSRINALTVSSDMCQFGYGDPQDKDFAFCGRQKTRGAFCVDHAHFMYQPNVPFKKKTPTIQAS